jgi:hypothetical protein
MEIGEAQGGEEAPAPPAGNLAAPAPIYTQGNFKRG